MLVDDIDFIIGIPIGCVFSLRICVNEGFCGIIIVIVIPKIF